MKILSNFTDYYDFLQNYGQDNHIIFKRICNTPINFNENLVKFSDNLDLSEQYLKDIEQSISNKDNYSLEYAWKMYKDKYNRIYQQFPILNKITYIINSKIDSCYFISEYEQSNRGQFFLKKNMTAEEAFEFLKIELEKRNEKIRPITYHKKNKKIDTFSDFLEGENSYFNFFNLNKPSISAKKITELHQKVNSPIIFIHSTTQSYQRTQAFIHMPLRFFGIDNAFGSPEQLFQEISYCVGNVILNRNEPPITLDDKVKISQNGFDLKISFRKR